LHNLALWWHFLAKAFGRSVGLWFLFVGLVRQSFVSTSDRLT
jgi:hypothetical protein